MESSTLQLSGLSVGDRTQAVIGGRPRQVTIVGEASFDAGLAGATMVAVDEQTAQQALRARRQGRRRSPSGSGPASSQAELRDRIARVLPARRRGRHRQEAVDRAARSDSATRWASSTSSCWSSRPSACSSGRSSSTTRSRCSSRSGRGSWRCCARSAPTEAGACGFGARRGGHRRPARRARRASSSGSGWPRCCKALFGTFGLKISGGLPVLPHTIVWSLVGRGRGDACSPPSCPRCGPRGSLPSRPCATTSSRRPRGLRRRGVIGIVSLVLGIVAVWRALASARRRMGPVRPRRRPGDSRGARRGAAGRPPGRPSRHRPVRAAVGHRRSHRPGERAAHADGGRPPPPARC